MIYLASNSPRRAELLTQIDISFSLINGSIDEQRKLGEDAQEYVLRLALEKAQAGFINSDHSRPVLGADTIVVVDHHVLEKPKDELAGKNMLQLLSGRTHQVFTAIAVVNSVSQKTQLVKTDVTFKVLSEQDIAEYWSTGEPLDKAGGYAIQGAAGKFITNINGSYSAVVGLPLYETELLINELKE
jgi:septum formation protein